MRLTICINAALLVSASPAPLAAKTAPFDIKSTSWSFIDHGKRVRETIDADGNYIENRVDGKHVDHGTALMKNGKACFTSAMTKEGEACYTTPGHAIKVGHSFVTRSDKGQNLKVTRIAYTKLAMPK